MRRRRDAVTVRSHRRGGRRRKLVLAPWIVITTVSVLLLSGVSAGYAWLATRGCSGTPQQTTIVSSPTLARILDNLGRRWAETSPSVNERCVSIKVVSKNSAAVAQVLGPAWNPRRDGPHPHVWIPDSTAWLKLASAREEAARLIPDRQPSLARTPTVIGMPMPMAKALGWPDAKLSWKRLGTELVAGGAKQEWARHGHPEWGEFKIGMMNPVTSTAGLHALMGIADQDDDGRITDAERQTLVGLSRTMKLYAEDPSKVVGELAKRDPEGEKKVLPYLSAFPILEHEVRAYNDANPRVPLAAVYPTDGTADADYPYLTLDAAWSKGVHKQTARQFLEFLRGPEGRQAFQDNFFRDPNRTAGKDLTEAYGTRPKLDTLPRAVLVPDSVSLTVASWIASNRPTNVLFVLDVSASMSKPVRGTSDDRTAIVRAAAARAVGLLSDKAKAGLWAYSSRLDGDRHHLELASLGPLNQDLGGATRREVLRDELDELTSGGADASSTYDIASDAYTYLLDHYTPNAANLVVLISDGKDSGSRLALREVTAKLAAKESSKRPVHLITIGYGADADMTSLEKLAGAAAGRSYHAQFETDINSLLITAMFNA
ncbi:MAG: substrate-binding and VWA domain-containing protein [Micromonosporaceae bacterium]